MAAICRRTWLSIREECSMQQWRDAYAKVMEYCNSIFDYQESAWATKPLVEIDQVPALSPANDTHYTTCVNKKVIIVFGMTLTHWG